MIFFCSCFAPASIVSLAPFSLNYVLTFKLKTQKYFTMKLFVFKARAKLYRRMRKEKRLFFSFTTHYTRMDITEKKGI